MPVVECSLSEADEEDYERLLGLLWNEDPKDAEQLKAIFADAGFVLALPSQDAG